jgi:hypothetical protein
VLELPRAQAGVVVEVQNVALASSTSPAFRAEPVSTNDVDRVHPRAGLTESECVLTLRPVRDIFGLLRHVAGVTREASDRCSKIQVERAERADTDGGLGEQAARGFIGSGGQGLSRLPHSARRTRRSQRWSISAPSQVAPRAQCWKEVGLMR